MAASLQFHLNALTAAQTRLAAGRERLEAATATVDDTLAVLDRALEEVDDSLQAVAELQPDLAERLARPDVAAPPSGDLDWPATEGQEAPRDSHLVGLATALASPATTLLVLGPGGEALARAAATAGARVLAVEPSAGDAARLRRLAMVEGLHDLHVATVEPAGPSPLADLADAFWLGPPDIAWFDPAEPGSGLDDVLDHLPVAAMLFSCDALRLPAAGIELRGRLGALGYGCYQVESHRLTAMAPGDLPWEATVECLATKSPAPAPPGWVLRNAATEEDTLLAIVAEGRHPDPLRRAALASRLASAPEGLRTHPLASATIEELADEPTSDDGPAR